MSHALRGFIKKFTGEATPDPLMKQPLADADAKLALFKDVASITSSAIEGYMKSMSKSIDMSLKEKFEECKLEFVKYENRTNEAVEASNTILLNTVINKTTDLQNAIATEAVEFISSLDKTILKPLQDYQKEVGVVKENRRELKDAFGKQESVRVNLDKARRDVENYKKQIEQLRLQNDIKRQTEAYKGLVNAEEKTNKYEKDLDDARLSVNEKYDRYTEGLFKRVSEETDLANCFLEYLRQQQRYHALVCQNIQEMIPEIKEMINNYSKKPIFGCSLEEHLRVSTLINPNEVSPVIRRLVESMIKQNAFSEEGIFRIAGSKSKMNRLIHSINSGYLELIDFNDYDVHCLASVLKQYLRDLPDSIMCNHLYEDWHNAINSPSKIDAFKQVLKKMPRANYENLKYIVKFLAVIVENSERTKMNANNIGICFGVSLLNTNSSESVGKNIDMGTATNAFDFMLSNHVELFPGDINFAQFMPKSLQYSNTFSGRTKPVDRAESEAGPPPPTPAMRNPTPQRQNILSSDVYSQNLTTTSPAHDVTNRHSVMVTDRRYIENDVHEQRANSTRAASGGLAPISEQQRGHAKKPSADFRFIENEKSSSPSPSPETTSASNLAASPRLKAKKQAPAPPPTTLNTSTSSINSSTLNDSNASSSNTTTTTNTNSVLFPKLPTLNDSNNNISSNNNTTVNGNNNNNNKLKTVDSSSNIAAAAAAGAVVIEKPNVPPPTVPFRPPPIGFNISLDAKVETTTVPMPMPTVGAATATTVVPPPSDLVKPPKPALPRKPTNNSMMTNSVLMSSTNQQQQQTTNEDDTTTAAAEATTTPTETVKISSEITSL